MSVSVPILLQIPQHPDERKKKTAVEHSDTISTSRDTPTEQCDCVQSNQNPSLQTAQSPNERTLPRQFQKRTVPEHLLPELAKVLFMNASHILTSPILHHNEHLIC
jgi:hypothetical protein